MHGKWTKTKKEEAERRSKAMSKKQVNRWLRALEIAKAMFYFEGYDDRYLAEIELFLREQLGKTNRKEVR